MVFVKTTFEIKLHVTEGNSKHELHVSFLHPRTPSAFYRNRRHDLPKLLTTKFNKCKTSFVTDIIASQMSRAESPVWTSARASS
jgi:hypothetical protein